LGRATLLGPPWELTRPQNLYNYLSQWAELNQRTRLAAPSLACELTLLSLPFALDIRRRRRPVAGVGDGGMASGGRSRRSSAARRRSGDGGEM